MYRSEKEERVYLDEVIQKLKQAYKEVDIQIDEASKEILETKKYIWNNIDQLDLAEKAANRMAVGEAIDFGEKAKIKKARITKMIQSPYFGRIDFKAFGEGEEKEYYIGIHSFSENRTRKNLIYDWRAPLSSMYYDFEKGKAFYQAPMGKIEGEITRKRQYKIIDSRMEYMLESSLSIGDDILQKELSQTTDEKMKNIVGSIQREQNAIIRDEDTRILIIQGCAGSGKSSIAMHRIAFLLYRFRGEISAEDILIISPNKVFTDYISNVLPELGEENIPELLFEEIADELMDGKIKFETHSEQMEELLLHEEDAYENRIREKSSLQFWKQLEEYERLLDNIIFTPNDIEIDGFIISKDELLKRFQSYQNHSVLTRIQLMGKDLIYRLKDLYIENEMKYSAKIATSIKKQLSQMLLFKSSMEVYRNFFQHFQCEELYQEKKKMEYADVFPYIYIKLYFEGSKVDLSHVRHLLIDEMQDYSPIQYAIIKKLFQCKITIMGDRNQNLNPHSTSSSEKIQTIFPEALCLELNRSYRSTYEITEFSRKISPSINIIPVKRHGKEVILYESSGEDDEIEQILNAIKEYHQENYHSFAILCKSQKQAMRLYAELKKVTDIVHLLGTREEKFKSGIIITSIQMAKGLEFDQVFIPFVNEENYHTELDRNLLYVATTRAMHKLEVSYTGKLSPLIISS